MRYDVGAMKNLISHCPPYLLFLGSFTLVVVFGLMKLYSMLQSVGLGQ